MHTTTDNRANRLINEKSPYLLQHAYNPVDWYPWGEEAFQKARELDRPIFLSIGYSTCHWCHVMERESFEDAETAELMNRLFVNIKLDREERPDIDRIYMAFVQATTGSGGWPMSVWLTPELRPFFGGTYFPPDDRYGRPGFRTVLEKLDEAWRTQRDQVEKSSQSVIEHLRAATAAAATTSPQLLDNGVLYRAFKTFQQNFDPKQGGFGQAPKFPRPVTHNFLFRYFARTGDEEAARMVMVTLFRMANGGMYDHLGGGFHRYSVDGFWHVPHFEKMLYDQAQLAISYVEAYQLHRNEFFARIARETLDYVLRDMTDASGGFYSAEDADSLIEHGKPEHAEGAFYVWTAEEIAALLGPDAEAFNAYYWIKPSGNADDPHGELTGKNILHAVKTPEDVAAELKRDPAEVQATLELCRTKLFDARAKRPRPHLDDKIITAWNGLMISALSRAAQVLDEPRFLDAARRAAQFIATSLWNDTTGTLARRYRDGQAAFEGNLEDYAFFAQGLLDLYEASFELEWLKLARRVSERMVELFRDSDGGGFFSTSGRDASVLVRMKDDYDGAEPSGNSIAALTLMRLAEMMHIPEWEQLAGHTVQAFSQALNEHPHSLPQMLVAFMATQDKAAQVVIAGDRDDERTRALLRVVHERFIANKVLLLADDAARAELGPSAPWLTDMRPQEGKPTAYVCRNFACEKPVSDPEELRKLL